MWARCPDSDVKIAPFISYLDPIFEGEGFKASFVLTIQTGVVSCVNIILVYKLLVSFEARVSISFVLEEQRCVINDEPNYVQIMRLDIYLVQSHVNGHRGLRKIKIDLQWYRAFGEQLTVILFQSKKSVDEACFVWVL